MDVDGSARIPRIAHVISTRDLIGGAERVALAIARHTAALGWDHIIVNPFAASGGATPFGRAAQGVGNYTALPCDSLLGVPRLRRSLDAELRDFDPDIVHVHLFYALVAVSSLRRGREARLLSHQHGETLRTQGRRTAAILDRAGSMRYGRIIACSDHVRRYLLEHHRVPAERVVTIHNGWEGTPAARTDRNRPTAVCVANFRKEKGHDLLLEAWRKVVIDVPSAVLHLIGDGPLRHELEDRVRDLGIDQSVVFVGTAVDVWRHLADAHVFVLPSIREPFGIVAAEAMAAGLPVIAADAGGLREVVDPGVTGRLVAPGDTDDLARAVVDLLLDPELRARMGAAAINRAQQFSLERTVEKYLAVYRETMPIPRPTVQ